MLWRSSTYGELDYGGAGDDIDVESEEDIVNDL